MEAIMTETNKQGTMGQATRKSMEHDRVLDPDKGRSDAQKKAGAEREGRTGRRNGSDDETSG